MSQSHQFSSIVHQRIQKNTEAEITSVSGPVLFFNPTQALLEKPNNNKQDAAAGLRMLWRARDNRKGRHMLVVPSHQAKNDLPPGFTGTRAVLKGIWRMLTVYAWWDVSWWIAVLFTIGSAIFVLCGFFYWLPLAAPSTEFHDEALIAGGVTAFVGATLFTIGGVLLIVEATNENQTGCFGWALSELFSHTKSDLETGKQDNRAGPRPADCEHHHANGLHSKGQPQLQHPESGRKWEWWPSWNELTTHYFREIGFWASITEAIGAIIFYISGIMALPGIYDNTSQPVLWGVYWLAYLIGGILFVTASLLYMLEVQPKWYKPAPKRIGWWIGTWNLLGSVGWTLSASFGYCSTSWCGYQSDLSLLWASIAFLIGSALLWYEAMDKHPVKIAKA
ncbi:hypothetical protein AC578_6260 [Pseudocercospora eumusae]|uniref:Uncharacterized protein n=1 Tax=Pseudocercospora eumusae TaxID=321146 RepID=A0A139H027_9PEZI|nr:hypothetical protein AC578_6260 [Pseudocercospora eumusae]